jgi:hypothetical protein
MIRPNIGADEHELVQYAKEKIGGLTPVSNEIVPPPGIAEFEETTKDQPERIPILKLIQAMSDDATVDGVKPGSFRNTLSGEVFEGEIEFIPITPLHQRVYFEGRERSCWSRDSLVGEGIPGGECRVCPKNKWYIIQENGTLVERPSRFYRKKKGEGLLQPECRDTYLFPSMILAGHNVPAAIMFSRGSLGEGDDLVRLMKDVPLAVYRLSSITKSNEKGKWFAPKKKLSRQMTDEEMAKLNVYRRRYTQQLMEVEPLEDERIDEES